MKITPFRDTNYCNFKKKKIMKYSPTCNFYLELTVVCMCIVITEWAEVMQIQLTLWLCLLAAQVQSVSKYNCQSYPTASRVLVKRFFLLNYMRVTYGRCDLAHYSGLKDGDGCVRHKIEHVPKGCNRLIYRKFPSQTDKKITRNT